MLERLEETLADEGLSAIWREILDGWDDATAAEKQLELAFIEAQCEQFMAAARDIEEPEELELTTVIQYIELKSHWIKLNTQLNYQMFKRGESDRATMFRAALISSTLSRIEPLIADADIRRITDFLANPIDASLC